jgi:hypothetical protein
MNDNQLIGPADGTVTATQEKDVNPAVVAGWQAPLSAQDTGESETSLWLGSKEVEQLRSRWNSIQAEFVDAPRTSVEKADELVVDTLEQIEQAFAHRRTILDESWINNEEISTEQLRVALKNYRAFLDRLLAL